MTELPMYMGAKKAGRSSRQRKSLAPRPNGRSADFIMAGFATGCQLACSYCYVARHRPFGNPLETYDNLDAILAATRAHWQKLPAKRPNQCDPLYWTYDIGESTDCLTPAVLPLTLRAVEFLLAETGAKPTFATKVAGGDRLPALEGERRGRARVRASLMPQAFASRLEAGTSPIAARLGAANEWVRRGWEVHLNFSPVVAVPGWGDAYAGLFRQVRETLTSEALAQVKAEVIFLTHHPALHDANLAWAPEAEDWLWQPRWQEAKTNHRGDTEVVRYRYERVKPELIRRFRRLLGEHLPECGIRYIF